MNTDNQQKAERKKDKRAILEADYEKDLNQIRGEIENVRNDGTDR